MRPNLLEPVRDQHKLAELLPLTQKVFLLHEMGHSYANELKQLSRIAGRVVGPFSVDTAFGSGSPEYFARSLLIDWDNIPADLTRAEMLEALERVCAAEGSPDRIDYWVKCLAVNTGEANISDLIFWPAEYLGEVYDGSHLSAAEILEIALRKRDAGNAA